MLRNWPSATDRLELETVIVTVTVTVTRLRMVNRAVGDLMALSHAISGDEHRPDGASPARVSGVEWSGGNRVNGKPALGDEPPLKG